MKCEKCKNQNGCARCEACHVLFCFSCFTQHHTELSQEFQRLTDHRNRLKESLEKQSSGANHQSPSIAQIYQWETEMIEQIRRIAAQARNDIQNILQTDLNETSKSLDKISVTMQQKQKDGIVLENDLDEIRNQLNRIQRQIEDLQIKVNVKISKDVDWKSMIQISKITTKPLDDFSRLNQKQYSRAFPSQIPDKPRYRTQDETDEEEDIVEDW